jgi:hypothetical protein
MPTDKKTAFAQGQGGLNLDPAAAAAAAAAGAAAGGTAAPPGTPAPSGPGAAGPAFGTQAGAGGAFGSKPAVGGAFGAAAAGGAKPFGAAAGGAGACRLPPPVPSFPASTHVCTLMHTARLVCVVLLTQWLLACCLLCLFQVRSQCVVWHSVCV